jgi:hypothetical protein
MEAVLPNRAMAYNNVGDSQYRMRDPRLTIPKPPHLGAESVVGSR